MLAAGRCAVSYKLENMQWIGHQSIHQNLGLQLAQTLSVDTIMTSQNRLVGMP